MPTYQYQCTACHEGFEVVQKFTEDSLTDCPSCDGRLKKVFSAVGIVFKGSGFYRNDSRNSSSSGSPAAAKSGDKADKGSGGADKGSADKGSDKSGSSDKKAGSGSSSSSAASTTSTASAA